MFITSFYDVSFNFESSLGKKEKNCDERTNGRTDELTDGVTLSLLELLIAAKNSSMYIVLAGGAPIFGLSGVPWLFLQKKDQLLRNSLGY